MSSIPCNRRSARRRWIAALLIPMLVALSVPLLAESTESWFTSFRRQIVPPIKRSDTTQLMDVGRVETDGFSKLIFSIGGEFKEGIPDSGRIGVILIPDIDTFQYVLRNEGKMIFPIEAKVDIRGTDGAIFMSEQQMANVAFPAYRVYLYNETNSGAEMSVFIYRVR